MYLCDKPRSLVEQKKIQWAKERGDKIFYFYLDFLLILFFALEELAKLSVPWGRQMKNYEKNGR